MNTDYHSQEVRLAVVIAFHNRKEYLRETLTSFGPVFDQDIGEQIEFILVGDGSENDVFTTADIPSRLQPLTRLFWFPPQGRPAAARNFGVEQSRRATHLMFVDSDDRICAPGFRKALETVGRIKADVYPFNFRYISAAGEPSTPYGRNVQFPWYDVRPFLWTKLGYRRALLLTNPLMISSFIRRDAFHALGGFDEAIPAEDYELWLSAAYSDCQFCHLPYVVCEKREHQGSRSFDKVQDDKNVLVSIQTPRLKALMGSTYRKLEANWLARVQATPHKRSLLQRLETVAKSL
jgi:glycosyltransferase involved in cell wall biosynthesis